MTPENVCRSLVTLYFKVSLLV